ncbi:hypothetical protein BKA69DRAFT_1166011 [Paraphysoderma sedebokerense]|nr:hypothetical protein BKA69DRAFT_1166011 [Paraphysoderma sedebokerense]
MLSRFFRYWTSQYITEKLLASPSFHRFAARTHQKVTEISERGINSDVVHRAQIFKDAFKENIKKEVEKLESRR